jgi:hypothetical protein
MKQRQPLFSKITIIRVTKIYVVLLCIMITETFANEAYLEGFSLKVENVNIINIDNVRTKQQTVVTGKVVDEKGYPISRITVLIKGTSRGITTDFDRNYSLYMEDSNSILVDDINNDQKKDILLLGNLYGSEVETSKAILIARNNGKLSLIKPNK